MAKLTEAQRACLLDMTQRSDGSIRARDTYKPTQKLVSLGFATRKQPKSWIDMAVFTITDAGHAALAAQEKTDGE